METSGKSASSINIDGRWWRVKGQPKQWLPGHPFPEKLGRPMTMLFYLDEREAAMSEDHQAEESKEMGQ